MLAAFLSFFSYDHGSDECTLSKARMTKWETIYT
jgi:hypothetical protein